MPMNNTTNGTSTRELSAQILPWRRAETLLSCHLFWIPARLGDMPPGQREWLLSFYAYFTKFIQSELGLKGEIFMSSRTIHENSALKDIYLNSTLSDAPIAGRCRRLHQQKKAKPPTQEDIDAMAAGKKKYVPYDYVPENAYWFLSREDRELRERYMGYGGLTMLYRKPDEQSPKPSPSIPATMPFIIPKFIRNEPNIKALLEGFDPRNLGETPAFLRNHPGMKSVLSTLKADKLHEKSDSLQSRFGSRSKEIFGDGMPRDITFEALPFLLPQFTTQDFFTSTEKEIHTWFDLFDVYVRESTEDDGVVLACKDNPSSAIAGIITKMRNEGFKYWEG
jgi:hypothetical protein